MLCPLPRTSDAGAPNRPRRWPRRPAPVRWSSIPASHDRAVAAISHLPYLAAAALVNAVAAGDDPLAWALAASGFRDTTRVAASDVDMMLDILLTNRDALLPGSDRYIDELSAARSALTAGDEAALRRQSSGCARRRGTS